MRFLFLKKKFWIKVTLIERHCYEVPILIKPNWACEIVNLLIRVRWRLFVLLHYFGDKFSVGAVNFHSVGRLIVGYLTERSMWRNFDNSEHLLGLTEGQTVPNSTGDLHQLNFDLDEKTEFLMSPWAQGMYHSYASHENITIYEGIYQRGGFMFRLYLFNARSTFKFFEKTPPPKLWGTKWVHDFFGQTRKGGREQYWMKEEVGTWSLFL